MERHVLNPANVANWRRSLQLLAVVSLIGCGPDPAADNHAKAIAVLERAGEGAPFADASTAERAAIRHEPSGMVCVLPRDGPFDLAAFPATAANPGAYCSTVTGGVAAAVVAVRFVATNLDRAFAEALAESAGRASPQPWTGEPSDADKSSPEGLPHFRIARFEATIDGSPHYLRVAMSETRGWYLQQIVSAPLDRGEAAEAEAGTAWRGLLAEFAAQPPAAE